MMPKWATNLPWQLISEYAEEFKLDANLFAAIIQTESSGHTWRTRFECVYDPGNIKFTPDGEMDYGDLSFTPRVNHKYLVTPERFAKKFNISVATEISMQFTSWGLGQVMGYTARDMGYQGYLTELLIPAEGLYWSAQVLASKTYLPTGKKRYESIKSVIASYNRGSVKMKDDNQFEFVNQVYVDKVWGYYEQL
jgi:hypothetical protein